MWVYHGRLNHLDIEQGLTSAAIVKNDILYTDGGLEVFIGDDNGGFANGTEFIGYSMLLLSNRPEDSRTHIM